ncbi:MAG: thioredoxin family protein [Candidatus Wallbacteria bacterium]|nr:thioredoxin family protein [Candidatus Wallbacteria bacterium]
MKKTVLILMMMFLISAVFADTAKIDWLTDYQKVLQLSAEKNLPAFLVFQGSDWCSWCQKLDKEVTSQPEFIQFASVKFICMSVDFPKHTAQSPELKAQNQKLSKQYGVSGLPTVKVIDSKEKVLLTSGYREGGAQAYVDYLKASLNLSSSNRGAWLTDMEQAKKLSAEKNLPILADFAGSDWCCWCKKLDKEVFSQQVFLDYAKNNLVLLLVDFPESNPLPADQTAANQALLEKYKVDGFPTVILMDKAGTEKARTGYKEGGPEKYIEHIKQLLGQ